MTLCGIVRGFFVKLARSCGRCFQRGIRKAGGRRLFCAHARERGDIPWLLWYGINRRPFYGFGRFFKTGQSCGQVWRKERSTRFD